MGIVTLHVRRFEICVLGSALLLGTWVGDSFRAVFTDSHRKSSDIGKTQVIGPRQCHIS